MLNIFVIRQSVYWITGSFNYVYPLFMLFSYWYILLKFSEHNFEGKKLILVSTFAFLASATVEQSGMMTFGLTVLFCIYNFIIKQKENLKKLIIILLCSLIGLLSVICSPAQFTRFGLETEESFSILTSINNGINFFIYAFIKSDLYKPHILLLLLTVFISFITFRNSKKLNTIQKFLLSSSFILRSWFSNNDASISDLW